MNTRSSGEQIAIIVNTRSEMEHQLHRAVQILRGMAQKSSDRGILVTRHSAREFTAELHSSVPFGITREVDNWRTSALT